CVFGFRVTYAMDFPLLVQLAADFGSSVCSRSFSPPPPPPGFLYSANPPAASEAKTIMAPSGDQTGRTLLPAPSVNRELTPRARSRIQMSPLAVRASVRWNARRSPVGESAGLA